MDKRHCTKSAYKLHISFRWLNIYSKGNKYLYHVDEVGFDTSLTFSMTADFNENYIHNKLELDF